MDEWQSSLQKSDNCDYGNSSKNSNSRSSDASFRDNERPVYMPETSEISETVYSDEEMSIESVLQQINESESDQKELVVTNSKSIEVASTFLQKANVSNNASAANMWLERDPLPGPSSMIQRINQLVPEAKDDAGVEWKDDDLFENPLFDENCKLQNQVRIKQKEIESLTLELKSSKNRISGYSKLVVRERQQKAEMQKQIEKQKRIITKLRFMHPRIRRQDGIAPFKKPL